MNAVKGRIPQNLQNAFFELIEYPVRGAALMNQKILYAQMSLEVPPRDHQLAVDYSQKAKAAFEQIKGLTQYYNTGINNGKWNGIITYMPRNLAVYGMPAVGAPEVLDDTLRAPKSYDRRYLDTARVEVNIKPGLVSLDASDFKAKHEAGAERIAVMPGLGLGGKSISRYPFNGPSYKKEDLAKAPYVEYVANLKAGTNQLSLKCLPTRAIHKGRSLGLALSVNKETTQFVNVNNPKEDRMWKANILRGYSEATLPITINREGETIIRVYLLDTGLALSRIDINQFRNN